MLVIIFSCCLQYSRVIYLIPDWHIWYHGFSTSTCILIFWTEGHMDKYYFWALIPHSWFPLGNISTLDVKIKFIFIWKPPFPRPRQHYQSLWHPDISEVIFFRCPYTSLALFMIQISALLKWKIFYMSWSSGYIWKWTKPQMDNSPKIHIWYINIWKYVICH